MTLLNPACFDEIIGSLRRDGVEVHHFCVVAGNEVLRRTAVRRDATGWAERKYHEYEDAIRLVSIAVAGTLADQVGITSVYFLGGALLLAAGLLGLALGGSPLVPEGATYLNVPLPIGQQQQAAGPCEALIRRGSAPKGGP